MSRLFLPRHHRTHERGGSDEIRFDTESFFGSSHQSIPLSYFGSGAPNLDVTGYAWVADATSYRGGYVEADADDDYFSGLVLLEPRGSIWQLNTRWSAGPDFGIFRVALASLLYESDLRPSGDSAGKIQDVDGAYGSFTYVELTSGTAFDCYSATPVGDVADNNSVPFIVGGQVGDPLTDFTTGVGDDPLTGFTIADGGPGWYRLKVYTDGKNASSSGYRVRISDIILTRRSDDNAF